MSKDLLYQIALTLVPHIGDVQTKLLVQQFGDAASIFKASKKDLNHVEGIGEVRAASIKSFTDFDVAEKEISFLNKYSIQPLFLTDSLYPKRLLNCYDSPAVLYYKGTADLNSSKIISIVGTRNHSEYGKSICESIIEELANEDILIISGLAFGIDSVAHKACIKNQIKTVGVLAHGLDRVYPSQNKTLAKQMALNGGLLTEFRSNTNPDRQNFPARNRIVAGMSDCVIVIETGLKGGSLITAELGNGYNKDVFAIPGRTNDPKSEGCNYLIQMNKAGLITSGKDILESMGWHQPEKKERKKQRELFIELSETEKTVVAVMSEIDAIHIDELYLKSKLSSSSVAQALLMLEMQGVVHALPGKMYRLN